MTFGKTPALTAINNPFCSKQANSRRGVQPILGYQGNAVAITADYQKEVNDLNKGSLDAEPSRH